MTVNPPLSATKTALLEKYRRGELRDAATSRHGIPRRPPGEPIPLSFGQQQIWLLAQMMPDLPTYNMCVPIYLTGPLDVIALERSVNEIVRRHEAWCTTFAAVDGEPVQVIHPPPVIALPVAHLEGLPEAEREAGAVRLATEDARTPFDLARGPLLRMRLVKLDDTEHRLYLTLHHIIFDGVSLFDLFLPELTTLYEAFTTGAPSPLPEFTIQYADYAHWQRQRLGGEFLNEQLSYWRRTLHDPPLLQLPTDYPRPAVQSFRGALQHVALPTTLTDGLKELSRREGVTLYMTLMAAFVTLLHRYAGQDDIVVGTVTSNRDRRETEKLLGFFLNTLALRADLSGDPTFRDLLQRVRRATLEAQAHADVPFELVVRELHPQRTLTQNPLFGVMFTLEPPLAPLDSPWSMSQLDIDLGTAKFDLSVELDARAEGIVGRFEYSTDLFAPETIARMVGHYQTLLESIVADAGQRLSALPLLTEAERHQVLVEWNATEREYPRDRCVHHLVAARAERTPDAVAVVCGDKQLTYGELDARANRLAHHLRALGVGPETLVALCMERSPDMMIGLLGILKAGGAYVPLDPEYPAERLHFMLEDARARVVLTQERLVATLPRHTAAVVCLDRDREAIAAHPSCPPQSTVTPDNLAYVIYTSGSTGKPKGVMIPHRALMNLLWSMREPIGMTDDDVILATTSLSFDIAGFELYLPLLIGARIVIVPRDVTMNGRLLAVAVDRSAATILQGTPTMWTMLLEAGWQGSSRLHIISTGEPLSQSLARQLLPMGRRLTDLYGPTETTIWSTMHEVTHAEKPIPLGRPIANTQVYILDCHHQPLPVGVPGELYIGGDGLARGYLNRPDLTAQRFIPQPIAGAPSPRLYATGDLTRYQPDGTIDFLGRMDYQVKVRGFRIELGEIEAALNGHPAIHESVVVAREELSGDKRLVAYVVSRQEAPSAGALRQFLKAQLPDYMIPAIFVTLDAFPVTANGKLDRGRLPAPDASRPELEHPYVPPRTATEAALVEVWEEVLDVRPIGLTDNFFDLGGHSLLAVRLFARLEERLGTRFPIVTLFHAPTIAQLAAALHEGWTSPFSSVVPIQPEGTKPPFFCVHGYGGSVIAFKDLAEGVGHDQPFYGLQPREFDGIQTPLTEVGAIAAHYLSEMRHVQPTGPYYLGGYSDGAIIAFEMARQLHANGEEVALFATLDGGAPGYGKIPWTSAFLVNFLANLPYSVAAFVRLGPKGMIARAAMHRRVLGKVARKRLAITLRRLDEEPPEASLEYMRDDASQMPEQLRQYAEVRRRALLRYVPRVYPGRITVLRTHAQPLWCSHDRALGWRDLAGGGVEIVYAPGKHHTLLFPPYVAGAARTLRAVIEAARRRQRA